MGREQDRRLVRGRASDRIREARKGLQGGFDLDRSLLNKNKKSKSSSGPRLSFDDHAGRIASFGEETRTRDPGGRDPRAGDATASRPVKASTASIAEDEGSETAAALAKAEDGLRLPPVGFSKALKAGIRESSSVEGLRATVRLVPSAYRYAMAVGVEELTRSGYEGEELEKELRKLYARHKRSKGRCRISVELSTSGSRTYYFLQSSLKKHLELRAGTKKTIRVEDEKPKPRFENWQIFEQRHGQKRQIYRKPLAPLDTLRFDLTAKLKPGSKTPIELKIAGVVRVRDRREEQRSDYRIFEGINLGTKQISSPGWASQILPLLELKFYPGRWEGASVPEEFKTILQWLEENR